MPEIWCLHLRNAWSYQSKSVFQVCLLALIGILCAPTWSHVSCDVGPNLDNLNVGIIKFCQYFILFCSYLMLVRMCVKNHWWQNNMIIPVLRWMLPIVWGVFDLHSISSVGFSFVLRYIGIIQCNLYQLFLKGRW